jgi:hypothetical protein
MGEDERGDDSKSEARPLHLSQALKEDRGRGAFRITTWSGLVGSLQTHTSGKRRLDIRARTHESVW